MTFSTESSPARRAVASIREPSQNTTTIVPSRSTATSISIGQAWTSGLSGWKAANIRCAAGIAASGRTTHEYRARSPSDHRTSPVPAPTALLMPGRVL